MENILSGSLILCLFALTIGAFLGAVLLYPMNNKSKSSESYDSAKWSRIWKIYGITMGVLGGLAIILLIISYVINP